jgi:hypothetical protein
VSELSSAQIRELVASVPHWHHIFAFPQGITTPGAYDPRDLFSRLRLPDLRGKRVLDVGTRDGFFAFECERRGAHVDGDNGAWHFYTATAPTTKESGRAASRGTCRCPGITTASAGRKW